MLSRIIDLVLDSISIGRGNVKPRSAYKVHQVWHRQEMDRHPWEKNEAEVGMEVGVSRADSYLRTRVLRANDPKRRLLDE